MAWNFQFGDTFAHYNLAQASSKGKWTIAGFNVGLVAADGMQTAHLGLSSKTFAYASQAAKPIGRGVWCRCTFENIHNTFVDMGCGIKDSVTGSEMRLQLHDGNGSLRVVGMGGAYISATDSTFPLTSGEKHNFQVFYWWNSVSGKVEYEVRVDNNVIAGLTTTNGPTVGATPGWDQLIPNSSGGAGPRHCEGIRTFEGTPGTAKFTNADFRRNTKRYIQVPDADGLFAATVSGAEWVPNSGTDYFSRLNENPASEANYAKTITDPNGAPTVLSRASVKMANLPGIITSIEDLQRVSLMHSEVGTGSIKRFTRSKASSNPASLTYDSPAITPLSAPNFECKAELLDPRDGAAWSPAKVSDLERGLETQDLT